MRPVRIIVGEVRGPEALDMLNAGASRLGMSSSHCTMAAGPCCGGRSWPQSKYGLMTTDSIVLPRLSSVLRFLGFLKS